MQAQQITFKAKNVTRFFTTHLDKIYYAKLHLVLQLPRLAASEAFSDLKDAINETLAIVKRQIQRLNMIYDLIGTEASADNCRGQRTLVDDAYCSIEEQAACPGLRDFAILFYLQNIQSIELTCSKMLKLASEKLGDQDVEQLLQENFDDARADDVLLLQVSEKYLAS
ncbi:DUF892 family protein [Pedobacter sp. PWIIR3]